MMGFALSKMQVKSDSFEQDGMIPSKHTGEGADVSPALQWTDQRQGTKAFAIICHDPDAPLVSGNGTYGFVHWVLYNIPGEVNRIEENVDEYTSGKNDSGQIGYTGPMPPNGHGFHRYYFWVLALNEDSELEEGLTLWELLAKIEPHVIGMNRLVGRYHRD
jgi:Raf kinase inhibitor-like YbhB/YbcL family protein